MIQFQMMGKQSVTQCRLERKREKQDDKQVHSCKITGADSNKIYKNYGGLIAYFSKSQEPWHTMCKGGFMSEKSGGFLLLPTLPKNIPFYYPKLSYPVHGIDKIIIEFDIFQVKKNHYGYKCN